MQVSNSGPIVFLFYWRLRFLAEFGEKKHSTVKLSMFSLPGQKHIRQSNRVCFLNVNMCKQLKTYSIWLSNMFLGQTSARNLNLNLCCEGCTSNHTWTACFNVPLYMKTFQTDCMSSMHLVFTLPGGKLRRKVSLSHSLSPTVNEP